MVFSYPHYIMKLGFFNTGFPKVTFAFVLVIFIVIANVGITYFIIQKNKLLSKKRKRPS